MLLTDGIADMLTRIRNAALTKHEYVDIPYSNIKGRISDILKDEGYVNEVEVMNKKISGMIRLYLKYDENRRCIIHGLKRISKPGRRVYARIDDIPRVLGGLGTVIISTNKGVITDRAARVQRVGGEVLCFIW